MIVIVVAVIFMIVAIIVVIVVVLFFATDGSDDFIEDRVDLAGLGNQMLPGATQGPEAKVFEKELKAPGTININVHGNVRQLPQKLYDSQWMKIIGQRQLDNDC